MLEGAEPGAVQRVVPDGRPELILNLGRPFEMLRDGVWQAQPQCFLAGQITGPLLLRAPGGIAHRRRSPAPRGSGPTARHSGAGTDRTAASRSTIWASSSLADRDRPPRHRTGAARTPVGPSRTGWSRRRSACLPPRSMWRRSRRDLGVSSRQLERRFKARVGMPPKLFARIRRFQRVFPAIEK